MDTTTIKPERVKLRHTLEEWGEGHPDRGGDGYWITLKPGWKWIGDSLGAVHSIHEPTKTKAHQQQVIPCDCEDCAKATGGQV